MDEFYVYFEFIKVFTSMDIQKELKIEEFLNFYSSRISFKRKREIKSIFIDW
jgi:hypothetical protein